MTSPFLKEFGCDTESHFNVSGKFNQRKKKIIFRHVVV